MLKKVGVSRAEDIFIAINHYFFVVFIIIELFLYQPVQLKYMFYCVSTIV